MSNRVIFVDEDPYLLKSLKRMLRSMRHVWQIEYAGSAEDALNVMRKAKVDVILTELRLTGMDGIALLEHSKTHCPDAVRIVMSGYTGRKAILKAVGIAHQFIAKPWNDGQVQSAIQRAFVVQSLVNEGRLKNVIAQITYLPSLPSQYEKVVTELKSEDPSMATIAKLISEDPSMLAKIMKMVNSSFFNRPVTITDPVKAVGILGLDTIQAVILTAGLIKKFNPRKLNGFPIEALWQHSLKTGYYVKEIGKTMAVGKHIIDDAYMAALLHDIGKLLLAYYLPGEYDHFKSLVGEKDYTPAEAENLSFGVSHADVGAYLLGLWGFPLPLINAVRFHHHPICHHPVQMAPLTLVHCANALQLSAEQLPTTSGSLQPVEMDYDYLSALGLKQNLPKWCSMTISHLR